MKLWGILFLMVPLLGRAYVFWRSWQLMPFCTLAKTVILLLMALALVLVYVKFRIGTQSEYLVVTLTPTDSVNRGQHE